MPICPNCKSYFVREPCPQCGYGNEAEKTELASSTPAINEQQTVSTSFMKKNEALDTSFQIKQPILRGKPRSIDLIEPNIIKTILYIPAEGDEIKQQLLAQYLWERPKENSPSSLPFLLLPYEGTNPEKSRWFQIWLWDPEYVKKSPFKEAYIKDVDAAILLYTSAQLSTLNEALNIIKKIEQLSEQTFHTAIIVDYNPTNTVENPGEQLIREFTAHYAIEIIDVQYQNVNSTYLEDILKTSFF